MAFCDKKASKSVFFISSKYVDMGIKRSVFLSQIQQKKAFYKIMKNSKVGAEKLGKTAEFVISLIFFHYNAFRAHVFEYFYKPFAAFN